MTFRTRRTVEWGDCDAAGIVFYPNYFRWMDAAFHEMTRDLGFDQGTLPEHGVFATPLRDAGASFTGPARHGTVLDVSVRVTRLGRSGIALAYAFADGARAVATGHELRVCVVERGDGIAATPLPPALRALLERHL